ncbi:hypothetical protein LI149_15345, partial [Dorea sp. 210702-DFI.3.17]|nr:hypothetical protein [Dorea sp. 210702-DFI.3.17]
DEKQAFSRIIYENCYHLTSMLNNLLEIAQLDSGNDSLPLVPTRIHELCLHEMQQVLSLFTPVLLFTSFQ